MANDGRSCEGTQPTASPPCQAGSGVSGGVAGPTPVAPAAPGVGVQVLAEARRFVLRLQDLPGVMHQLDEQGLAELLQCLLVAGERCESMTALALADAVARGTVASSTAANPAQLVQRLGGGEPVADVLGAEKATNSGPLVPLDNAPEPDADADHTHTHAGADVVEQARVCALATGVAPGRATGIAKVADSLRAPVQEGVIGEALRQGKTSVGCARTALREADRVQPVLPAASRGEVIEWFLNLGSEATPRELKNLGRMIIATFGDQNCLDDRDEKLRTASSLRWSDLPGGLTRFVAELAPTEAAMVKQAIHALSAPNPDHPNDSHGDQPGPGAGAVDERPVERRRADALVELLHQAAQQWESSTHRVASGKTRLDKDSVTGRATLVITTDLDTLAAHRRDPNPTTSNSNSNSISNANPGTTVAGGVGGTDPLEPVPGCGCGVTLSGDVLPRSTVQLIGCDGGVTVISKNENGTPTAYGRRDRLFTGALRTLIVDRDRCCTFPGCGRPPDWCQVHHIDPWEAGGETTYENGTLLCQRHHTIVHSRQLTADLVEGRIEWDLRRGRMLTPGHQKEQTA